MCLKLKCEALPNRLGARNHTTRFTKRMTFAVRNAASGTLALPFAGRKGGSATVLGR
jgi:hypothetical protein